MPQDKKQKQSVESILGVGVGSSTDSTQKRKSTLESILLSTPEIDNSFQPTMYETAKGYAASAVSSLNPVLDFLSRGQYASAKFFDAYSSEGKGILESLSLAAQEAYDPKERLSYSTIIEKNNPEFARENPKTTAVLGFLADVALDPTSYLGVGLAKSGIQVAGKTLTTAGVTALKTGLKATAAERFIAKQGIDVLDILSKEARQAARTGQTAFSPAGTQILQQAGYFDELTKRTQEVMAQFGSNISTDAAEELAKKQIYRDLKNQSIGRYTDEFIMSQDEVREVVEQRISKLVDIAPDAINTKSFKLFESTGLRLKVGVPFGKQFDIPGTEQLFNMLGVNRLGRNIKDLASKIPGAAWLNRAFNKYAEFDKLPEEFVDNLRQIENTFDELTPQLVRDVVKIGKDVSIEGRKKIQDLMYKVDDATRLKEEELGRAVTQAEADGIKMSAIQAAKLSPEEHALVANMYQGYAQMSELELRANLLRSTLANYSHREYEVLKDPTRMTNLQKRPVTGVSTFMGSSQARDYATVAEAKAAGLVPEMDALVVYAQRLLKHREKMAAAHFNDSVREAFNLPGVKGSVLSSKEFAKLPKVAQNSIRMLGESVYPSSINSDVASFLRILDRGTSLWKKGAYSIKPSSAAKQLVSNTIAAAMVAGAKSFKSFDPRAAIDSAVLLFSTPLKNKALPNHITKLISGGFKSEAMLAERIAVSRITGEQALFDYADQFSMRTVLGTKYTGKELVEMARNDGVIKGFDSTGETLKIKINNALRYNPNSIGSVAGELAKVWNWPAFTEDYSRMMLWMNGLKMGYSSKEALKLVNKGLYDYSRGLSFIEKNVLKRAIPFYTYPRFAIPFVLKNVIEQPGTAATSQKFVKTLEKMFTGDTMTESERNVLGDSFLIEQPFIFKGFDKDGKAGFNVLNNMTPFEILSVFATDKNGSLDVRRTFEKSVLAAMTPFIKVPVERLLPNKKGGDGYEFFTQKAISDGGKLGDINESTLSAVLPSFVKSAIGWENRVNPKTGKQSVYINPYLAHATMSFIPGIRTYINLGDQTKTPYERAFEIFTGVASQTLDLKEQAQWISIREKKELADLKGRITSAKRKGSTNEYERSLKEYRVFLESMQSRAIQEKEVRGQGMNVQNPIQSNPDAVQSIR